MGKRKFRLSVQRKNHERKRWGVLPVQLPVKGGSSTFKVSVPLYALSDAQRTALLNQTFLPPAPTSLTPLSPPVNRQSASLNQTSLPPAPTSLTPLLPPVNRQSASLNQTSLPPAPTSLTPLSPLVNRQSAIVTPTSLRISFDLTPNRKCLNFFKF